MNKNLTFRFLEQPAMNGRPAEWAMIIESGDRIAEGEWYTEKSCAVQDMVEFLEAALVIARSTKGE